MFWGRIQKVFLLFKCVLAFQPPDIRKTYLLNVFLGFSIPKAQKTLFCKCFTWFVMLSEVIAAIPPGTSVTAAGGRAPGTALDSSFLFMGCVLTGDIRWY